MKWFLIFYLISPSALWGSSVLHLNRDVQDKKSEIKIIVCPPDENSIKALKEENFTDVIRDYKIEFVGNKTEIISSKDFKYFIQELRKFPAPLLKEISSRGVRIRLLHGNGVSEDPEWKREKDNNIKLATVYREWYLNASPEDRAKRVPPMSEFEAAKKYETTPDGLRNWDVVSGSGGVYFGPNVISPTRIVINRIYRTAHREIDGTISYNRMQGTANLFLHEHAHSMDNLYRRNTISSSLEWKSILADSKVRSYLPKIFSENYELMFPEEGFAEAFAYYHSCEASRKQMEEHAPALANYFKTFTLEKLRALENP